MNKTLPQSIMPTGSGHVAGLDNAPFNSPELCIEHRTFTSYSSALTSGLYIIISHDYITGYIIIPHVFINIKHSVVFSNDGQTKHFLDDLKNVENNFNNADNMDMDTASDNDIAE